MRSLTNNSIHLLLLGPLHEILEPTVARESSQVCSPLFWTHSYNHLKFSDRNHPGCQVGSLSCSVVEQLANSLRMTFIIIVMVLLSSAHLFTRRRSKEGVSVCKGDGAISLGKSYTFRVGDSEEPRIKVLSEKEDRGGMSGASEWARDVRRGPNSGFGGEWH